MNKLVHLLRTPYPAQIQRWKTVVIPAVIIFLILYLLQPFGIAQAGERALLMCSLSALLTAGVSALFSYALPTLFPRFYDERRWTVGRYLLNLVGMLMLIAVAIWLLLSWLTDTGIDVRLFGYVMLWVLILAPFPTVVFTMWSYNLNLRRHLQEAMNINASLSQHPQKQENVAETSAEPMLTFCGNTKECLSLKSSDFLYAESDGNYIRLNYLLAGDGKMSRKLLRLTMKQAEEITATCPDIMRCHRAFLVNVDKVVKVTGNSQGLRLRLEGCTDEVPVSRVYVKQVKTKLED